MGLFGVEGPQGVTLRNALAQIVWTATEGDSGINGSCSARTASRRQALLDNLESTADAVDRGDYRREN